MWVAGGRSGQEARRDCLNGEEKEGTGETRGEGGTTKGESDSGMRGWRWGREAWREKLRKDGSAVKLKAIGGLELRGKV